MHYVANRGVGDMKLSCEFGLVKAMRRIEISNGLHLLFCELAVAILLAPCLAVFLAFVSDVILMSADPQMSGIYAGRIVAPMQNVFVLRDRADQKTVGESMSGSLATSKADNSIATMLFPSPVPTFSNRRFFYTRPKEEKMALLGFSPSMIVRARAEVFLSNLDRARRKVNFRMAQTTVGYHAVILDDLSIEYN